MYSYFLWKGSFRHGLELFIRFQTIHKRMISTYSLLLPWSHRVRWLVSPRTDLCKYIDTSRHSMDSSKRLEETQESTQSRKQPCWPDWGGTRCIEKIGHLHRIRTRVLLPSPCLSPLSVRRTPDPSLDNTTVKTVKDNRFLSVFQTCLSLTYLFKWRIILLDVSM